MFLLLQELLDFDGIKKITFSFLFIMRRKLVQSENTYMYKKTNK